MRVQSRRNRVLAVYMYYITYTCRRVVAIVLCTAHLYICIISSYICTFFFPFIFHHFFFFFSFPLPASIQFSPPSPRSFPRRDLMICTISLLGPLRSNANRGGCGGGVSSMLHHGCGIWEVAVGSEGVGEKNKPIPTEIKRLNCVATHFIII